MHRTLRDRVVVITGASSGIGRATAIAFARAGSTVVVAARRAHLLDEVVSECDRLGAAALAVPTDVTDAAAVEALARTALERFGRIDVWVNNAGVTLFARLEESPLDAFRRVIETNLLGYVHGARAVIPTFREQGHGVLVNVASQAGKITQPYASAYVASKWAVVGLSGSLRQELIDAPYVHVCTVLPASIDTPLFQHAANYTGRAVRPLPPVYDAERVAAAIVACAEDPEREVIVGNAGRMMTAMHVAAPSVAERLGARMVERRHFQDRPAEPTSGNLFAPTDFGTGVSGGWRRRERDGADAGLGLLGGLVVAGLGAVVWMLARGASFRSLPTRLGAATNGLDGDRLRAAGALAAARLREAGATATRRLREMSA